MGLLRKFIRAKNAYCGHYINGIKHYNWHSDDSSWLGDFIRARFAQEDWKKLSVVSVSVPPGLFVSIRKKTKSFLPARIRTGIPITKTMPCRM